MGQHKGKGLYRPDPMRRKEWGIFCCAKNFGLGIQTNPHANVGFKLIEKT